MLQFGIGELAGVKQLCCYLAVPVVVLSAVEILPLPPPLESELVDEVEGNTSLIQKVSQVTPVVPACLYGKDDTSGASSHHLCSGFFQCHLKTFPGVIELKLAVSDEILGHGYCRMLLLVWVNSHYQIPLRDLPELPCCAIFHSMAPPA